MLLLVKHCQPSKIGAPTSPTPRTCAASFTARSRAATFCLFFCTFLSLKNSSRSSSSSSPYTGTRHGTATNSALPCSHALTHTYLCVHAAPGLCTPCVSAAPRPAPHTHRRRTLMYEMVFSILGLTTFSSALTRLLVTLSAVSSVMKAVCRLASCTSSWMADR